MTGVTKACMEIAEPLEIGEWVRQIQEWKQAYPIVMKGNGLTPQQIMRGINHVFDEAVIVTDVGQNQLWATQFLDLHYKKRLLK